MPEFYRVMRVRPNGVETQIGQDTPFGDVAEEQVVRSRAFATARSNRDGNGWRVRVYSSSDEQVTPDDLIWDSAVNE